jgi:transposase
MERKGKSMWQRHKKYDEVFRRRVLQELAHGSMSYMELTRHYGLSKSLLSQWVKRYGLEATDECEEADTRTLKARVAELERMVGRLTMENDFLKKFAAYTKERTNERLSIVTPKTWEGSKPASSLGLPAAPLTTAPGTGAAKPPKTPGLKNG